MNNYRVEEYTELDFEHVTLESEPEEFTSKQWCQSCGTEHHVPAGIWTCDICNAAQFTDIRI